MKHVVLRKRRQLFFAKTNVSVEILFSKQFYFYILYVILHETGVSTEPYTVKTGSQDSSKRTAVDKLFHLISTDKDSTSLQQRLTKTRGLEGWEKEVREVGRWESQWHMDHRKNLNNVSLRHEYISLNHFRPFTSSHTINTHVGLHYTQLSTAIVL